ncbi:GNAT family N-acetyltransferase [Pacificibacter marinus]|uniref:GNAT family N-acetyltransferase n=1 Tax=Pacificibacter marinus TaxID=658057 RepID=UPI001C07060A|nr:GNAT family N-acetyltransferase [Pacificibacter marinus]MBU2867197.1 GNAT family N-acetyltransferase [Pacificibacter marinus]
MAQAPFQQRWLYGDAVQRIGRDVLRLAVMHQGEPVAIAQIMQRKIMGFEVSLTSRGPVFLQSGHSNDVLRALRSTLKTASLKLMSPDTRLRRFSLSSKPQICELDLSLDLHDLRAAQHPKWRNALKKAEASRLKVAQITATPVALAPLLQAEKDRQSHGRYRGLPPEFTLAIQDVAPKSLLLFNASDAQMLFIRHGNTASYHMGHNGPEGRQVNAHNLILWNAIKRLQKLGVTRLDLGTIDPKRAHNLARFKQRCGAQTRQLSPAQLL